MFIYYKKVCVGEYSLLLFASTLLGDDDEDDYFNDRQQLLLRNNTTPPTTTFKRYVITIIIIFILLLLGDIHPLHGPWITTLQRLATYKADLGQVIWPKFEFSTEWICCSFSC